MKQRIAVIGSGISGLSAAWLLSQKHTVKIYEANEYAGGHSHTIEATFGSHSEWIDTGFMVYNPRGYPELTKFFEHLHVPTQQTNMDFSVSLHDGMFEWATGGLGNIFADWKNISRPSFYRFLLEIPRFNKLGRQNLQSPATTEVLAETIDQFLDRHNFSTAFRQQYLYPMGSLIWSAPGGVIGSFPIRMVLEFFDNHNLLQTTTGNKWRSVVGGSKTYVDLVLKEIIANGSTITMSNPVLSVKRINGVVEVEDANGTEVFDAVVMATHADVTLQLLSDPTSEEQEVLGSFCYQKNDVIAHSDTSFMPKRKRAWVAWNFCDVREGDYDGEMSLTYSMNALNNVPSEYPIFITINPAREIAPELQHGRFTYAHPIQSVKSVGYQKELAHIQGTHNTYYSGCYFGYGFHEDGFVSGKRVAAMFDCKVPW